MKIKPLILSHLCLVILIGSFISPWTAPFWEALDIATFKFLNGTLVHHPWAQLFWAFVNHNRADLVEDVVFLSFFLWWIVKAPQDQKLRRSAQFIFCVVLAGSIIYFVNRVLLREWVRLPRESPSLVISPCIKVSEHIPWLRIKDQTIASFPGDHATTLILFAVLYTYFAGKKLGKYAWCYAIFRMLPRLVLGAHWLTDIIIGSGSLALFFLSWALFTPVQNHLTYFIEKFLKMFKNSPYEAKKDPL